MNTRQIARVATANNPWWVPATLCSRLKERLVTPPDAEQAIQLARSVVKNALKAAGFGAGEPDRRIVFALAQQTARGIFWAMVAAGRAPIQGNRAPRLAHLPSPVLDELNDANREVGGRKVQIY